HDSARVGDSALWVVRGPRRLAGLPTAPPERSHPAPAGGARRTAGTTGPAIAALARPSTWLAGGRGRPRLPARQPGGRPQEALGLARPARAADLLQPPLWLLLADGSRPGRPAGRFGRRPAAAAGGDHRQRR